MGRGWDGPWHDNPEPVAPYYAADVGDARDRFGRPIAIGDRVTVVAGPYINRTGLVLDCDNAVGAAAVWFPGFGTRVVAYHSLQRR